MRPDSNIWYSTNGSTMTDFTPDVVLGKRLRRFGGRLLRTQLVLALVVVITAGLALRIGGWFDPNVSIVTAWAASANGRPASRWLELVNEIQSHREMLVDFAAVVDREGRPAAMAIGDDELWTLWQELDRGEATGETTVTPMWRQFSAIYEAPIGEGGRYTLVVAMPDTPMLATVSIALGALFLSSLVAFVISIPLARRQFIRWGDGFKQLQRAMQAFASGSEPKPLEVGDADEMGYMMASFNSMVGKLIERRRALIEANEQLEHRVEQRTRELREAMSRLNDIATKDALTGLANRRALFSHLEEQFDTVPEAERDLVCIMFDLDGFKTVNDTLGHKMGDELLTLAADCLRSACRDDDLGARLGGDEFVLAMKLPVAQTGVEVADRIRVAFEKASAELLAGKDLPIMPSMSCGVSSRKMAKSKNPEQLLMTSDEALYAAKRSGKRRTEIYNNQTPAALRTARM